MPSLLQPWYLLLTALCGLVNQRQQQIIVYLHYVFDLWANQWRKRHARGDVAIVRFADDIVMGFEHRSDAERFHEDLRKRFYEFAPEFHPDKTRLIEFGRHAAANRKRRGEGNPESFDFLGFTHVCDRSRKGRFIVLRQTIAKRMQAKLSELKLELRRRSQRHRITGERMNRLAAKWLHLCASFILIPNSDCAPSP